MTTLDNLKFQLRLKLTPDNIGFLVVSLFVAASMPLAAVYVYIS